MTIKQAALLRKKWQGQSALETCRHLTLELEFTEQGDSTGSYVCIRCGNPVAEQPPLRDMRLSHLS